MKWPRPRRRSDILHGAALIAAVAIFLAPPLWMVLSSFKTESQIFAMPPVWFFHPTFEHYVKVFASMGMSQALWNSVFTSVIATAIAVVLGTPAGYGIARFRFRGRRDVWFWFISNFLAIPVILVIPYFFLARMLHLIDNDWALILIYQTFCMPLVVWLTADQFHSIPAVIVEAAKLDGASEFLIFLRVMVPLCIPSIVVAGILSLIFSWNELLYAMILTTSGAARTAPVTALSFLGGYIIPWGELMAAGTSIVLPVVFFAMLVSRYLVRGLTLGAVK
jgi:multiple sugar transport system permease protein